MATRLFVGNLPENTEESELRSAFLSYGEITNLELKSKTAADNGNKKFAFVSISGSNYNIESCIKHFSSEDFNGSRLYVTRARESFLERLQRERIEAQRKQIEKDEAAEAPMNTPVIKLGDKLNPRKRKIDYDTSKTHKASPIEQSRSLKNAYVVQNDVGVHTKPTEAVFETSKKKQDSDMKRMEAMKKRRQEFREKQMLLKSGFTGVDKASNKKVIFSDNEDDSPKQVNGQIKKNAKADKKTTLFDGDENEDSGDELNFEIKKQFEGKKGQKVLDLQSRYKSDKRFVLDERFIEDDEGEGEKYQETAEEDQIEVNQTDEKAKQLDILQGVLGVEIKRKNPEDDHDGKKSKPKIGMLRFDPSQPNHAKFLAPIETTKRESTKKSKKKTKDKQAEEIQETKPEEPRPEVSKEQFYNVSETLKEAIAQPSSFSLRSLFGNSNVADGESKEEETNYIPLEVPKRSKVKNPLEPGEKNPFVYDSSDSEDEEVEQARKSDADAPVVTESKAVWKESFFFHQSDVRFEEGLAFFTTTNETEPRKERRELKSLMKKRIYNKERKDQMQMFKKKIGGRKKTMKKSFRRKN